MIRRFSWLLSGTIATTLLVIVAFWEKNIAIMACGGEFVYPLDDTYIHIAMAKCLAMFGTWGVEPGKMAFCSSSPLWTLVLAGFYRLIGVRELLPWLLALLFNSATIFVVCKFLQIMKVNFCWQLLSALAVSIAGPFICTTALGMEHAMHGFFIVSTLAVGWTLPAKGWRNCIFASLLAAAATASRYESLFLLVPFGMGLAGVEIYSAWHQKQRILPLRAIFFCGAAGMPVFIYGFWAIANGGHFLPNSLLLKGNFNAAPMILSKLFSILGSVPVGMGFLYLLMLTLVITASLPKTSILGRIVCLSIAIAIVAQMLFAQVGHLCRYEAYLTSAAVFAIVICIATGRPFRISSTWLQLLVLLPTCLTLCVRAWDSVGLAVESSFYVRYQQVLLTRMLSEMPEKFRGCIALNDLGYMALHGQFPFLDIWGLGSQDLTERLLRHGRRFNLEDNKVMFKKHNVRYVVVFEKWFPAALMPAGTIDVAYMTLADSDPWGSDTFILRATDQQSADGLENYLLECKDKLPPRVSIRFCR